MFIYPNIDPVLISIGPLKIHWYGVMYLLGFLAAYALARVRVSLYNLQEWTLELINDLIFYAAMGVVLGGRLGYMLFYNFTSLRHDPLSLLRIWEGGMSFHGGLIGVIIGMLLFSRHAHKELLDVTDFLTPLVPLGLAAGRLGNFINGELWGRVTQVPWGVVFPHVDAYPRHPSQLYELALEGIVLFIVIWLYAASSRPRGCVSAIFLIGYALCRLVVECVREPDQQLGFFFAGTLTMGQCLSIPMLVLGLALYIFSRRKNIYAHIS